MKVLLYFILWKIINIIRRVYYKIFGYHRPIVRYKNQNTDLNSTNLIISQFINSHKPFLISRLGNTELKVLVEYQLISKKIKPNFSNNIYNEGKLLSGIFPISFQAFSQFSKTYAEAMKHIDMMATWIDEREKYLISKYCSENILITQLESIEPFFSSSPWTQSLLGRKVLIVHPFVSSIKKQLNNHNFRSDNVSILPNTEYIIYKPVVSFGDSEPIGLSDWSHALDLMVLEIKQFEFDIAIVAAGSYGLPLSAEIKNMGKGVIHLAGVTQILFGITGARWEFREGYKDLINNHWIRPLPEDFNQYDKKIFQKKEGPGYW